VHHPWVLAGTGYWALLGLTLHLNFGALLVGLLPTVAVVVNYILTKRKVEEVHVIVNSQRTEMVDKIDKQGTKIDLLERSLSVARTEAAAK